MALVSHAPFWEAALSRAHCLGMPVSAITASMDIFTIIEAAHIFVKIEAHGSHWLSHFGFFVFKKKFFFFLGKGLGGWPTSHGSRAQFVRVGEGVANSAGQELGGL